MKNKHIIAIAGNARSGKDTLGKNICELLREYDINAATYSFADQLRAEVDSFLKETLGISAYTTDDREKIIIRPFLVFWGTEMRRKMNASVWIDKLNERIKDNEVAVITDSRFENEYNFVKENGGLVVYLTRIDHNGCEIQPANFYEKENNVFLSNNADSNFAWLSSSDDSLLKSLSNELLETIITEDTYEKWKAISL
jgi:hypothetical protein